MSLGCHDGYKMKAHFQIAIALLGIAANGWGQEGANVESIAAIVKHISPQIAAEAESEQLRTMLSRRLRGQLEEANRTSSAEWAKIQSREEWEAFRREKLKALRASLGKMPARSATPRTLVTGRIRGDGFQIQNVVFESRPGLVVTANLYVPDPQRPSMPGIVISHSHHNPKEQGELQDMGMTWARAGCYVLVPDHLGHGERRQHPFTSAADYAGSFQVGRQDYYFRYDTSLQLYLAGESLMGWLVHDLMTGVDLLMAQPGIDAKRIAILGSVAGGGDPAGVTAALDERIAVACPFNFGGPQPETRYPLPEDAELSFNYAGGGSWESTRNLKRSAADGFLPWAVVGSIAPRHVIHAHEFAWDGERDPVWKRYQKIWGLYDATARLSVAHGHGTLTGQPPASSHCNNIGVVHRRQIHEAFGRWLDIRVRPEDEYSQRRPAAELACLTDEARREFQPKLIHQILADECTTRLASIRRESADETPEERRKRARESWSRLLGDVEPAHAVVAEGAQPAMEERGGVAITRELLETEEGILVPVMMLSLAANHSVRTESKPVLMVVADDGISGILQRRRAEIAARLSADWLVVMVEVRGTGLSGAGADRGPQSRLTSQSATSLMLGQPLVGTQLRDLRTAYRHVRGRVGGMPREVAMWGDSAGDLLPREAPFKYPHRVERRPNALQPSGALLALLFGLYEDEVTRIYTRGGLVKYQSALDSQFVQIPHDCIIPGLLREGDLSDLVAALAPREVRLSQLVDGRGREVSSAEAREAFELAIRAYRAAGLENRLEFSAASQRD
jgi:dienelactone hydrolase